MSRNTLKYIAAAAMLIDHISAFFIPVSTPVGCLMRVIGRLTAPIMCYFVAEGFIHTSSKTKYGTRLFIFAVISQLPYSLANSSNAFRFNMIFTLFIGFLILYVYEEIKTEPTKSAIILLLFAVAFFSEWSIIAPLWILSFYILRNNKKNSVLSFLLITAIHILLNTVFAIISNQNWYSQLWQAGLLLFIPVIFIYNGKKGDNSAFSKWFFYIFYPLHLFIIAIILNST